MHARFAGGICYVRGQIVAAVNLGQSGEAKQAHIRIRRRRLLRGRADYGTLGHERRIEILREPRRRFTCEKRDARKAKRAFASQRTPARDDTRPKVMAHPGAKACRPSSACRPACLSWVPAAFGLPAAVFVPAAAAPAGVSFRSA